MIAYLSAWRLWPYRSLSDRRQKKHKSLETKFHWILEGKMSTDGAGAYLSYRSLSEGVKSGMYHAILEVTWNLSLNLGSEKLPENEGCWNDGHDLRLDRVGICVKSAVLNTFGLEHVSRAPDIYTSLCSTHASLYLWLQNSIQIPHILPFPLYRLF